MANLSHVTMVINTEWDDEAHVWVAQSDDVPGLVTEAPTVDRLLEKLRVLVPELLELNGCMPNTDEIWIRVKADRQHEERISIRAA